MMNQKISTIAVSALFSLGIAQGAGAEMLQKIGKAEGQVNIVAWPGYIERGETDPEFDWVTEFEESHGLQGQRQDREHLGRDGGADERRRLRPGHGLGRRLACA